MPQNKPHTILLIISSWSGLLSQKHCRGRFNKKVRFTMFQDKSRHRSWWWYRRPTRQYSSVSPVLKTDVLLQNYQLPHSLIPGKEWAQGQNMIVQNGKCIKIDSAIYIFNKRESNNQESINTVLPDTFTCFRLYLQSNIEFWLKINKCFGSNNRGGMIWEVTNTVFRYNVYRYSWELVMNIITFSFNVLRNQFCIIVPYFTYTYIFTHPPNAHGYCKLRREKKYIINCTQCN